MFQVKSKRAPLLPAVVGVMLFGLLGCTGENSSNNERYGAEYKPVSSVCMLLAEARRQRYVAPPVRAFDDKGNGDYTLTFRSCQWRNPATLGQGSGYATARMYWYKSKSTKSAAKSAYDDFTKDAVTFKSGAAASRAAVDSSPLPSGDETRSYTERKEISTTHTAIYHANVEARRGNLKVSLLYGRERTNAVETEKLARQLVQELLDDAT